MVSRERIDPSDDTSPTLADPGRETAWAPHATPLLAPDDIKQIDRFTVLRKLGEGGMGVVFAARDPALNRVVALKLVGSRVAGSEDLQVRMMREAQALARLSHPNVVQVHDVGSHRGSVYVAMEYIDGVTLGEWQHEHPPRDRSSRRALIKMYIQAGRGLAAAHECGLVHRDFKPANVLIEGATGTAHVVDFGLACARGERADETLPGRGLSPPSADGDLLDTPLTRAGIVLGTPSYMAPEQRDGAPADARSDQYSFCCCLLEALVGERPSERKSGRPPQASGRKIPSRLRRALTRGLEYNPEHRWPGMPALLAELEREVAPRRAPLWAATALALLGGSYALVGRGLAEEDRACAEDHARARWSGVWDDARAQSIAAAFAGLAVPYADDTWQTVATRIDRRVDRWVAAHVDACEQHLRGAQSGQTLDRRMSCLAQRQVETAKVIDILAAPSSETALRAIDAVATLRPLEPCSDPLALRSEVAMPARASARARVTALREQVALAEALEAAGSYTRAHEIASRAVERARVEGYGPVLAEALHARGRVEKSLGRGKRAVETLLEAVDVSESHGDDARTWEIWLLLALCSAEETAQLDRAKLWLRRARASVTRIGGDPDASAPTLLAAARVDAIASDYDAGITRAEAAVEQLRSADDATDPELADALVLLANLHMGRGSLREALGAYEEALARRRSVFGPDHPRVADVLFDMANAHVELGEFSRADDAFAAARSIDARVHGERSPQVASILVGEAQRYERAGDLDAAAARGREAIAILAERPEARPLERAAAINLVAALDFRAARYQEALAGYEDARRLWARALPPDHPDLGIAELNSGEALVALGQINEAMVRFQRAADQFADALPEEHPYHAYPIKGMGLAHLHAGAHEQAIAALERALALLERGPPNDPERAEARWGLARALMSETPGDARGLTLAGEARAQFMALGDDYRHRIEEIDAWLEPRQGGASAGAR